MTTIIFQAFLILILCFLYGFQMKYLVSMLLGVFFGGIVDLFFELWNYIPIHELPNFLTFLLALFLLPFGISLAIKSKLTALPFDIIINDIALHSSYNISSVKLWFDVICVITTLIVSWVFHRSIIGIGIGTIISTFVTGKLIQFYLKLFASKNNVSDAMI